MRILFLSNFYPPARPGGYTQWCQEVAESLRARGHHVGVLTSNHEVGKAQEEEQGVYRLLHLDGDLEYYRPLDFFVNYRKRQRENVEHITNIIREFRPDLIFIWGMWAMSKDVPVRAERMLPEQVVYYLSDYWPTAENVHVLYWNRPTRRRLMRFPKRLLSKLANKMVKAEDNSSLKLDRVICVSQAVKSILVDKGLPIQAAQVIHGGTDLRRFGEFHARNFEQRPLKFLYAGQLVSHKGVHTAIEAMSIVIREYGKDETHLMIVGTGHPKYEDYLQELARREGIEDYVTFRGGVPKSEMPSIMQEAQILLFTSIYEEPFARMTQEAMLSGMVVLGTLTGGTKEILVDEVNGLTFPAENSQLLANKMGRLIRDPQLCDRLARAGRRTVLENFTLDRMVDKIENYLQNVMDTSNEVLIKN